MDTYYILCLLMVCLATVQVTKSALLQNDYKLNNKHSVHGTGITGQTACGVCAQHQYSNSRYAEIFYEESMEHIENPERGFMRYSLTRTSDPEDLTKTRLDNFRTQDGVTFVWRYFVLDQYEFEPTIAPEVYEHIRSDMQTVRDARFNIIVRFSYTNEKREEAPYGDADKPTMTGHIAQLSQIFMEFDELITVVQAGFIGTFGEWWDTTHFGDPDYRDYDKWFDGMSPETWQDRYDIMNAILDAVPENITVQFRYPREKYHLLNDTAPTVERQMLGTEKKYRISHHNDCFVSSATDVGTYRNYTWEYPYLQDDTQYCTIGGETCGVDTSGEDRHLCPTAVKEMSELHYTYLNAIFNQNVTDGWKRDGCWNEMHRNLGYRLVLRRAILPETVATGSDFCFELEVANVGYAAPARNRDVQIVFRNDQGVLYSSGIPSVDIRLWLSQTTHVIAGGVTINLPTGLYEVLVAITPQYAKLIGYSDYNILTANIGTPEYKAGLNNLFHTVQVTDDNTVQKTLEVHQTDANECPSMYAMVHQEPSEYERRYCDLGGCQ